MLRKSVLPTLLVISFFTFGLGTSQADEVNFIGTTSGTFNGGGSSTLLGLTYVPSAFNIITAASGAGAVSLGSFSLSLDPYVYFGNTFALQVTFSVPTGVASGPMTLFSAFVLGQVDILANGAVGIVFTNPVQHFTYSNAGGSGYFDLLVGASIFLTPGQQNANLSGAIFNATHVPAAVPEPSSLLLLGAGLLGLAGFRRSSARTKSE